VVNENDFYLVRIGRAGSKGLRAARELRDFFNENGFYLV
jgi:hypothetical protein